MCRYSPGQGKGPWPLRELWPTPQGHCGTGTEPPGAAGHEEPAEASDGTSHPGSEEDPHSHGHGDRYQQVWLGGQSLPPPGHREHLSPGHLFRPCFRPDPCQTCHECHNIPPK